VPAHRDPALPVDDDLDDLGRLSDQPVDVSGGSVRPGGVRDGELCCQCSRVPVVAFLGGEVGPAVDGDPSAPVEPPPDGDVSESRRQALLSSQQPALLSSHPREVVQCARQVGGAQEPPRGDVSKHALKRGLPQRPKLPSSTATVAAFEWSVLIAMAATSLHTSGPEGLSTASSPDWGRITRV